MSDYDCGTCDNRADCSEVKSQAVRDVSVRCGLTCHSDFEKVLTRLLENLASKKVYHVYDDHLRGLTFYVKLDDIYKEIDKLRGGK